jgi:hypothetical protein
MKMLFAAVALSAALASPALAITHSYREQSAYVPNHGMYIYPPDNHPHSDNPAWDVYDTRGRYVGSDPDPFIRDMLARGHGDT